MKYFKIFVITVILAVTIFSILYLTKIAKDIEEYTFSRGDSINLIVYTTSKEKLIDADVKNLLDYIETSQESLGIRVKNLGAITDKKTLENKLHKIIKPLGRYIVIDLSLNDKIINKETILIRVEKNEKYDENAGFANKIKTTLNKDRVNILGESKCYLQEFGDRALRVELSNKLTLKEAEKLIDKLMYAIYKNITDGEF
ncbi:hypothetical protein [Thermobrachium celere]|uniref:hypothetical protein n=1 Tax=Thermobrachium celere TaxID=53422 RepID=UPI0019458606|nr:hypothetical protein [Thermobrachium celere]GFR34449.1 hypothetical protein TCEA9_02610 [Thermobrachium celere]